jgi:hypothetical protein
MTHNSLGLEWKVGQLLSAWQHLTVHSDLTQSSGNEMGLIYQQRSSCVLQVLTHILRSEIQSKDRVERGRRNLFFSHCDGV